MESQNEIDLDFKINLLSNANGNQEFLIQLKHVLEYHNLYDLPTTEQRIFKNVLPVVNDRFERVYNDNFSLFETLDDQIVSVLIKKNLEVAFELTETFQETLNFIFQHDSIKIGDIESIIKHIPKCVLLFADHWKNSSDTYKNAFNAEISKLLEVIKHLYASFLQIIESSINISDNDELSLLVEALLLICELSKNLRDLDASSVISSWKNFGVVTAKYSTDLENCMDLRIPVTAICEDIYRVFETILNHDMETFGHQLKMLVFLIKILFKITSIFYQKLDIFALDLLVFYVKILSLPPDHFKFQQFSEAWHALDTDVFKSLDAFLQHLVMGESDFKNHLEKIPDYTENMTVFKDHPLGLVNLLCKILHIVATVPSDWCLIAIKLTEVIFDTLPFCHAELYLDRNNGGIYKELIVNTSAAILHQDVAFQSAEVLLRYLLQDDVFVAILALEIYTLVVSNIHPEECITLFINLLYGVNDLLCGFFTNRPEMVYLKKLLQSIFKILPDTLKDEVIKLFIPEQHIQIWRFLGFNSLPADKVQYIINPVVNNTSDCIRSIANSCSEDTPLNIAEGLDLLSTVNNLDITDPKFSDITKFINSFWANDFNCNELLENNIMNYFLLRTSGVTAIFIQNSILNLEMITAKLKTLSCRESYWIPVNKIISSVLSSITFTNIPEITKQHILSKIADIISLPIQNSSNIQLQETYLELLKTLNESQKDILNFLLDSLNPNVASQIFQYLEKYSAKVPLVMDHKVKTICFKHKCLKWKDVVNANILPPAKRIKVDVPISKPVQTLDLTVLSSKISNKTNRVINNKKEETSILSTITSQELEDDSSAAEVIERIKGEVKCLIKVCKTEKLTQKNVADLRILMSQISSLM